MIGTGVARPDEDPQNNFGWTSSRRRRFCFLCHSTAGGKGKRKALAHLDMTKYPFGGHHAAEAGAAVRAALGAGPDGARVTMPKEEPGRVTGKDLAIILKWSDAFAAAHPDPKARALRSEAAWESR